MFGFDEERSKALEKENLALFEKVLNLQAQLAASEFNNAILSSKLEFIRNKAPVETPAQIVDNLLSTINRVDRRVSFGNKETTDALSEAWRIYRGETMMLPTKEHVKAMGDEIRRINGKVP